MAWQLRRARGAERCLQQVSSLTPEALAAVLEALQGDISPGTTMGAPFSSYTLSGQPQPCV